MEGHPFIRGQSLVQLNRPGQEPLEASLLRMADEARTLLDELWRRVSLEHHQAKEVIEYSTLVFAL